MTLFRNGFLASAVLLGLALPARAQDAAGDGKKLFTMQCTACHTVQPGKNGMGPSLAGVLGRKAGSVEGFNYSPALKNSGVVWNEQTLDAWIANPVKDIPGCRMYFPGVHDAAKRQAIIAYLKTL
jgi:cytochrome c